MEEKFFEDMTTLEQAEHNLKVMKKEFHRMNNFYLVLLSIMGLLILFIKFFK